MLPAAQIVGATCTRIDHQEFVGDIVAEIKRSIEASVAVIADLSESRPNVLYELGYADARTKPTIQVCSTDLNQLPFDVRNVSTIAYTRGQSRQLQESLAQRLAAIV
jgi:nucleoside 2-deoxyribosyltransferase